MSRWTIFLRKPNSLSSDSEPPPHSPTIIEERVEEVVKM